ncbi:hypothetical protein [Cribrihabitans neustonicus]|uniref:hypothetical protein n=1 Tax=Cribrihabitans neustonicus TaxID=1429085 RepID=UPI003B5CF3C9
MAGKPGVVSLLNSMGARQAMNRIEGFALGTAFLLHSRGSGALLSSNGFGRDIYDALRADPELPEVTAKIARQHGVAPSDAAPLVEEVISQWQAAGLFRQGMCPFVAPVAYRVPHTGEPQTFRLGDRYVTLRCEDPQLSEQIAASLAEYAAPAQEMPEDGGATVLIDVIIAAEGEADAEEEYGVFRGREPVWGRAPQDLTRFHIIRECMDHLCTPSRVAAHLHAAAVAEEGRAVILAGGSGRGKTTLAMGLLAAGGALAADDHVALSVDGRHMLAFPAASAVKRGAWDLPQAQALGLAAGAAASPRDGVRYLRPPRRVPAAAPVAVAAIVFPEYGGAGAANSLARLDPAEALTRLIQTGGRVSRRNPSLAPLVALLERVPCYELRYGSTRYSVETCQSLLAR